MTHHYKVKRLNKPLPSIESLAMDYVDKREAMDKSMDREALPTDLSTAPVYIAPSELNSSVQPAPLINIIHRHDYYALQ